MIDFLWHIRGSIKLSRQSTDSETISDIATVLERQGKRVVGRIADEIRFDGPHLGPTPLHALAFFERGRFCIEEMPYGREIRYDLTSLTFFVFSLIGVLGFSIFVAIDSGSLSIFPIGAVFWLLAYSLNLSVAFARTRSKLLRQITCA